MIFICSWFDLQNNCSDFWIIFQILSKNGKIGSGAGMAEIVKPCIDTWEYYMVVLQNSLEVLINDTDTGKVTLSILDFFLLFLLDEMVRGSALLLLVLFVFTFFFIWWLPRTCASVLSAISRPSQASCERTETLPDEICHILIHS